MRKTLTLFITVFLIALSLYICVFASVNSEKENVIISEEYIYGDRKLAENVNINFHVQLGDNILWDIDYDINKNKAETDFLLYRDHIPYEFDFNYSSKAFNLGGNFCNYSSTGNIYENSFFAKPFKELIESAVPYEEAKKTISVSDYIDYYPISVEITFTDLYHLDTSLGHYEAGKEEKLITDLHNFFKIPVLKNHLIILSASVDEKGNVIQTGSNSVASSSERSIYDEYNFYAHSVIAEDKIFIYFSNKTYKGKTADMSEIPGGYGIYCLPYSYSEDGKKVNFDSKSLANIFPVDDESEVSHIQLSENEKQLYIITNENDEAYLTVIDTETYNVIQRIKVNEQKEQTASIDYIENEYVVINLYHEYLHSAFSLYTIDSNGMFIKEFTALTHIEDKSLGDDNIRYPGSSIYEYSNIDTKWDGKYLYVTNDFDEAANAKGYSTAGFSLSIYDKDGLQFSGNYGTSLSTGFDGSYASNYNTMISRYHKINITLDK